VPCEAVQWFTRSFEQLDLTVDDPSLRALLLVQLGITQQYSRAQGHRETLLQAWSIVAGVGDTDTLIEICLANTRGTFANVWNVDEDRVTLLVQALDVIADSQVAARTSLQAALASELWDLDHEVIKVPQDTD
jgi:hypothetical protein